MANFNNINHYININNFNIEQNNNTFDKNSKSNVTKKSGKYEEGLNLLYDKIKELKN